MTIAVSCQTGFYNMAALEAFRYTRGKLLVLDQLKLPSQHEYIDVASVDQGWQVINQMQVIFFNKNCIILLLKIEMLIFALVIGNR